MEHTRKALINSEADRVRPYLPANYEVIKEYPTSCLIGGYDHAGWTLDDYVLPRLASGLHFGSEITGEGE